MGEVVGGGARNPIHMGGKGGTKWGGDVGASGSTVWTYGCCLRFPTAAGARPHLKKPCTAFHKQGAFRQPKPESSLSPP